MRIATWNINSIRARELLLVDFLRRAEPDVLCLQETKVADDDFPTDELLRLGYAVVMAGQRTYNGVAIAARLPLRDVRVGLHDDGVNADRRLIAATAGGVRVYSAYVPNGKALDSPAFPEKLAWLARLRETLEREPQADVALCGDFNIARDERDVFDPVAYRGQIHFSPDEHRALDHVLGLGLVDAYRLHHPEGGRYTWWDYRGGGFAKNQGLRLDYVFLSQTLAGRCTGAEIDVAPRRQNLPSDHTPVVVELTS